MTAAVLPRPNSDADRLYVYMAYACALIAFAGFAPTYWVPVAARNFAGPPILHLHALLFSAWVVFFIVQTTLVATGRVERHRMLGLMGISLATGMLFVGILAALHTVRVGIALGLDAQNRAFSIVPITIVMFFACAVAAAVANISRPDVHKRLMLVATISLLPPAFARLIALAAGLPFSPGHPPPLAFSLLPSFASDLLLIAAIVWDRRRLGRFHRTYLVAGACLVALQIIRVPLGPTTAWHEVTNWLLAFGG
jgi:FtsH-binding integral membrane protein